MQDPPRRQLAVLLRVIAVLCVGSYGLPFLWPRGWVWHPLNPADPHFVPAIR